MRRPVHGVSEVLMKVGMMQPSFMPWQGFFELIFISDIFIFLDDFQFSVQSYHQRNRLFVNTDPAELRKGTLFLESGPIIRAMDQGSRTLPRRSEYILHQTRMPAPGD